MARKIGDIAIALIIFLFVITALTSFVFRADATEGVNSGIRTSLLGLQNNASGVNTLETEISGIIDESGDFIVEENTDLEERGGDVGGVMNLISKNVLVRLFSTIGEKLNIPAEVIILGGSLIFLTIMILFLRMFLGDTRI